MSEQTESLQRNRFIPVVISLVVILLVLAGVIWFVSSHQNTTDHPSTNPPAPLPSQNTSGTSNGANPNGTSPAPSSSGTTNNLSGNPKVDQ